MTLTDSSKPTFSIKLSFNFAQQRLFLLVFYSEITNINNFEEFIGKTIVEEVIDFKETPKVLNVDLSSISLGGGIIVYSFGV